MIMKFFDFEVYPEWWCVTISDKEQTYNSSPYNYAFTIEEEENIKSKMRVYTSDMPWEVINTKLREDVSKGVLTGYNIKFYDLVILNAVLMRFTPHQLSVLNDILIHPERANIDSEHTRISQFAKKKYLGCEAFQDLMDDTEQKSLKDKEAAFGMDIRETTVPFDKVGLTEEDKESIIFYNKHDVYALHVYYQCVSKPYIDTKLALCKTYNLSEAYGYKSTNAVLSATVLGAERMHGTTITDPTITIYQPELRAYIEKWVPSDVYNHLLTKQEQLKKYMFENDVVMADGGLHSIIRVPKIGRTQGKLYVEANDEYGLYNIDASSCYPSGMIFGGAMSRAITQPQRFVELFKRRLELKMTPKSEWTEEDKLFVPAAKLVLNTTYGAMGNKYLALFDDYMRSKTCRLCQLILIAIAHDISDAAPDLKVIQTNTDGILVYCKRSSIDKVMDRVHAFEKLSGFTFELDEDKRLWQLNVNNYIAEDISGKLKLKGGAFVTEIWQKGTNRIRPLSNHIIAKAQIEYYVKGTNPVAYILDNNNVRDMCLVCTKGNTYPRIVLKTETLGDIELGKLSRVMAIKSNEYGVVKKQKYNPDGSLREDTCAGCPPHALVMNDNLDNYIIEGPRSNRIIYNKNNPTEYYDIDYSYYVEELEKALDIIWYELKDGQFIYTKKFNLGGV